MTSPTYVPFGPLFSFGSGRFFGGAALDIAGAGLSVCLQKGCIVRPFYKAFR